MPAISMTLSPNKVTAALSPNKVTATISPNKVTATISPNKVTAALSPNKVTAALSPNKVTAALSSNWVTAGAAVPRAPREGPRASWHREFVLGLLLALGLAACGARPGLDPLQEEAGGQLDGGPTDAPFLDALVLPDAETVPVHCTWTPGERAQITQPPSDKAVHSLVLSEDALLMGYRTTNPDPPNDNTHYLVRLSHLGAPQDDKTAIFPPPAGWYHGYMSLGATASHQGAIVWDDSRGCRFRPLDQQGLPTADPRQVGSDRCVSLRATHSGFSFFATSLSAEGTSQWRLVSLDHRGAIGHESAPIPAVSNDAFWWASVSLPEGSYVVAGMEEGLRPTAIWSQHIDHRGAPLGDPMLLTHLPTSASVVRLVDTGDELLAGWLAADQASDSSQRRRLTVQRLNRQGHPVSEPFQPTDMVWYRDAHWSWQRRGNQILTALVAAEDGDNPYGDATTVTLLPMELTGSLSDPPVPLTSLRFARRPVLRSTPLGVLVTFTGILEESPHQIFAVPATCEEDHGR